MADNNWTDLIAAERMSVDQRFEDRVEGSSFSRQQWGLVMTAVEFDIEGADDPSTARIMADTSKLSSVMSEVENLDSQGGGMAPGGGDDSGGLLGGLTDALPFGGGGGGGDELTREAEELTQAYADELQDHLEERGRWESICEQAASS